jgi:chemotaxis signal transduction protein
MAKLIVLKVNNKFIGIPSKEVMEIVEVQDVHQSPFSFPFIVGTTFWRGAILTIVSMSYFLGDLEESKSSVYVRLAKFDNLLLEVDSVERIIDYNELKIVERKEEGIYTGLYPSQDIFISILNVSNFCALLEEETISVIRYGRAGR